jgi:hypothetical protein
MVAIGQSSMPGDPDTQPLQQILQPAYPFTFSSIKGFHDELRIDAPNSIIREIYIPTDSSILQQFDGIDRNIVEELVTLIRDCVGTLIIAHSETVLEEIKPGTNLSYLKFTLKRPSSSYNFRPLATINSELISSTINTFDAIFKRCIDSIAKKYEMVYSDLYNALSSFFAYSEKYNAYLFLDPAVIAKSN